MKFSLPCYLVVLRNKFNYKYWVKGAPHLISAQSKWRNSNTINHPALTHWCIKTPQRRLWFRGKTRVGLSCSDCLTRIRQTTLSWATAVRAVIVLNGWRLPFRCKVRVVQGKVYLRTSWIKIIYPCHKRCKWWQLLLGQHQNWIHHSSLIHDRHV